MRILKAASAFLARALFFDVAGVGQGDETASNCDGRCKSLLQHAWK